MFGICYYTIKNGKVDYLGGFMADDFNKFLDGIKNKIMKDIDEDFVIDNSKYFIRCYDGDCEYGDEWDFIDNEMFDELKSFFKNFDKIF